MCLRVSGHVDVNTEVARPSWALQDLAQHLPPHTGEGHCLPFSLLSVGMPGLLSACGHHMGVARFREPQWLSVVSEPLQ